MNFELEQEINEIILHEFKFYNPSLNENRLTEIVKRTMLIEYQIFEEVLNQNLFNSKQMIIHQSQTGSCWFALLEFIHNQESYSSRILSELESHFSEKKWNKYQVQEALNVIQSWLRYTTAIIKLHPYKFMSILDEIELIVRETSPMMKLLVDIIVKAIEDLESKTKLITHKHQIAIHQLFE